MTIESEFLGLYFSSIVPRFLLSLAVWYPLSRLASALGFDRIVYFPNLCQLALFLALLAASTTF
ncbi:DUF1656 domain-containing protein [Luteolibacter pohnpeiensis]|uniref:DUF1656 domain-containing protein n=1 Tax=Luteolibacter pohnpeiensis TaxID=454153 RepID=A0A934VUR1_9BACT|nr:DUF1656 domain-containing protein [Luteolibacter pohnpeiensis]MBK1882802.1 DUF1656 domain-containing protein [Luteolibacter pohnpeiensis]